VPEVSIGVGKRKSEGGIQGDMKGWNDGGTSPQSDRKSSNTTIDSQVPRRDSSMRVRRRMLPSSSADFEGDDIRGQFP
jgi:hypothetical protein